MGSLVGRHAWAILPGLCPALLCPVLAAAACYMCWSDSVPHDSLASAQCCAHADQVAVKYIGDPQHQQGAVLALTGPKVTEQQWKSLPAELQFCKDNWRTIKTL